MFVSISPISFLQNPAIPVKSIARKAPVGKISNESWWSEYTSAVKTGAINNLMELMDKLSKENISKNYRRYVAYEIYKDVYGVQLRF